MCIKHRDNATTRQHAKKWKMSESQSLKGKNLSRGAQLCPYIVQGEGVHWEPDQELCEVQAAAVWTNRNQGILHTFFIMNKLES